MSEVAYDEEPSGLSPAVGVFGALAVSVAGLGIALLNNHKLSLVAYVLVLVLGVGLIALYRYLSMQRTMSTRGFVVSRAQRRLALLPVALVFLSCAANAYVWASEVAKQ